MLSQPSKPERKSVTLRSVLLEFQEIVGVESVLSTPDQLISYEQATFATTQKIPLVILPKSVEQVQAVVRIANKHVVPIYPISRGRNWGLGSRVPVQSGCCVVDMHRMNQIITFDEQNAAMTVEPGVTFQQVAEFLKERKSSLYLPATGGPPDGSVLANALERGDGIGPLGDRANFFTGLQVILPTGELLHTGLQAYRNSLCGETARFGLGPALEQLFVQSNLGIVTRMSIVLARRPNKFQIVVFTAKTEKEIRDATTAVKLLNQQGIVGDTSFSLWNVYRFLTAQIQYPWEATGGKVIDPQDLLKHLPKAWHGVRWIGFLGIYSPSSAHMRASGKLIRRALKGKASRYFIIGPILARLIRCFQSPLTRMTKVNMRSMIDGLYFRSAFVGQPTKVEISSIYWRKRGPKPQTVDPNRDRSGLHWICVALPYDGTHIARVTQTVEEIALRHKLEPMCMFFNMSQWYLKSFIVVMFDQDVPGEEESARSCHDEILTTLDGLGYSPIRLGIQSMQLTAPSDPAHVELVRGLKRLVDPNDILAPGRYDYRHQWHERSHVQLPIETM